MAISLVYASVNLSVYPTPPPSTPKNIDLAESTPGLIFRFSVSASGVECRQIYYSVNPSSTKPKAKSREPIAGFGLLNANCSYEVFKDPSPLALGRGDFGPKLGADRWQPCPKATYVSIPAAAKQLRIGTMATKASLNAER